MGELQDVAGAIARERAELLPDARVYPVAIIPGAMPAEIIAAVFAGLEDVFARAGWHAHWRTRTGLAVVWIRPATTTPPDPDDHDDDDGPPSDLERAGDDDPA